jgi:hypothetical protein
MMKFDHGRGFERSKPGQQCFGKMAINPGPDGTNHKLSELIIIMSVKTELFEHRTMANQEICDL